MRDCEKYVSLVVYQLPGLWHFVPAARKDSGTMAGIYVTWEWNRQPER